jgi:hypothetical protein
VTNLRNSLTPGQIPAHCSNCGIDVNPVLQRRGQHIRGDCPRCGKFMRFLKQRDADLLPSIRKMLPRLSRPELDEVINFARVLGGLEQP